MKRITLQTLRVENWRGIKSLLMSFDGDNYTIKGANGCGKSSVLESYLWCLTGKDSQGRTDFEIKRRDAVTGDTLKKVDAIVELTLAINGSEELKLKRTFHEKWQKPKGSTEEVFRGNETLVEWNDVPLSISEYNRRVEDLIGINRVLDLSTPTCFLDTKDWKAQREVLFELAKDELNTIEETLLSNNADYRAMLDQLGSKSLEDHRKELKARKGKLNTELAQIQPRIDQTERMKPEVQDWDAIEQDIAALEARKSELQEAERNRLAQHEETLKARKEVIDQISKVEEYITNTKRATKSEILAEIDKDSDGVRVLKRNHARLRSERSSKEEELRRASNQIKRIEQDRDEIQNRLEDLRVAFTMKSREAYEGDMVCPTCRQPLPASSVEERMKTFEANKKNALAEINQRGKRLNQESDKLTDQIKDKENEVANLKSVIKEYDDNISKLSDKILHLLKEPTSEEIDQLITERLNSNKGYQDAMELIKNLQGKVGQEPQEITSDEVKNELKIVDCKIYDLRKVLNDQERIAELNKELGRLDAEGVRLVSMIAECERDEDIASSYCSDRLKAIEEIINKHFSYIHWQLFDYTQDGNEYEVCIPAIKHKGARLASDNSASRILAGFDVVHSLSELYDVTVPLFVDNKESYQHIPPINTQLITMEVSKDACLTCVQNR